MEFWELKEFWELQAFWERQEFSEHLNYFMEEAKNFEYKPSGAGGTCSPPATLYRLQNPK